MHPFQQAPPVNYSAAAHSLPRSSSQGGTPTGAVFSSTNGRVTTPSMPYPTTQYPSYNVGNTMTGMPKVGPVIHSATGAMHQGIPPQYPLQQNARASPSPYESPPKMNGPMGGTQPQPPTTPYSNQLLNGSYPGTMANMSHQFAQMVRFNGFFFRVYQICFRRFNATIKRRFSYVIKESFLSFFHKH